MSGKWNWNMYRLFLLLALLLPVSAHAIAPLPDAVIGKLPELRPVGEGRLRWFGLHIYDAALWTQVETFRMDSEFALDIHYARNIPSKRLIKTSVKEMRRLGFGTPGLLSQWSDEMVRVFPDIRKGDRLTGVNLPGAGAEFFYNGRSVGLIGDAQFARAFFSIWLDPRTRAPSLRESMIGQD